MTDLLGLLVLAGVLLAALPQLLGYAVGSMTRRRGNWWPMLLAIAVPPAVFFLLATHVYGIDSETALQGSGVLDGKIEVTNTQVGCAVHAIFATVLQALSFLRPG